MLNLPDSLAVGVVLGGLLVLIAIEKISILVVKPPVIASEVSILRSSC